jgi:C1A family cysteine protease
MKNTWGNLGESDKSAISSCSKKLNQTDIERLFSVEKGKVYFNIVRKTEKSLTGPLDLEMLEMAAVSESIEDGMEESALSKEINNYEIAKVVLIPPDEFDYNPKITKADKKAAESIDAAVSNLSKYFSVDSAEMSEKCVMDSVLEGVSDTVDHRPDQSPIKNQENRGTCVSHASMAVIEAFGHIPDDLSEQYTHYKFMEFSGQPHNDDIGLKTTDAAPLLARSDGRVCLESDWPYIPDQETINDMVAKGTYRPPENAIKNQTYGIDSYKIITDKGLEGESIKNTKYLETLLDLGYNIVIGTWVSWDDKDNNGILDPVLDSSGKPVGKGGHAMLVVGYNRPSQYFIVKNSWGPGWGHNGYAYFHYNLIRSCFKYGYVVDSVVPVSQTNLPRKLIQAAYSTDKISRERLKASILFLKTSKGRYAVCEAYAGNNLLLKNIRVYNEDGTLHLEKDRLIVRGTSLCDIDSCTETNLDADFWWEAVSPGVNFLVPRNGAKVWVAYDLAKLTPDQIDTINLTSVPVPKGDLNYAVIAGRTTANLRYKILVNAKPGDKLQLSYVEVFRSNGKRYLYATDKYMPSSCTYNLDNLTLNGGEYADIWWHVVSEDIASFESYSTARHRIVWNL